MNVDVANKINECNMRANSGEVSCINYAQGKVAYYGDRLNNSTLDFQKNHNKKQIKIWERVVDHFKNQ